MNVLDLFSGIGGFSLAAHWMGWKTVAFCEQDKFCQKVLAKNFSGVPIFDDIKTLKGDQFNGTIDIVCGGFPCQPWSTAGKRRGKEDDRHLWPEMFRIIKETRPRWVVGENVAGIIRMGLDDVLADLESEGYTCQSFVIPACGVGAQHRRDRVWIVGYSKHNGFASSDFGGSCQSRNDHSKTRQIETEQPERSSLSPDFANTDRERQLQSQRAFKNKWGWTCNSNQKTSSDSDSTGQEQQQLPTKSQDMESGRVWKSMPDPQRAGGRGQAKPGVCGGVDGIPGRIYTDIKDCFSVSAWVEKAETGPNYKNRIKALGNSIVPQVVYQIFKAIQEVENELSNG